ncbi:GGDEF domain-containing protein [Thiobacillus sedimenti]|uniref:diguanylate cyclase n=1 Tax=Thiobacillus sedimenti TaxID=3110231 RepID=A0ABZ1CI60_9PROT|nr:diguanylate cyclase [Thiobacillus sp. SCUT-2]WRS37977.1 diguanylate cyclase [Thiobacillus sp. SCUT-2]
MLCPPEELLQKNQALSTTWQRYQALPSFESFVELAVSINSFTEFLIDKGVTALHHASHQLEQVTLALFNKDVGHPLPQAALDDLNERLRALTRMTHAHASATAGLVEREQDLHHAASQAVRLGQIWVITDAPAAWNSLQTQLGYFGLAAGFIPWETAIPDSADVSPLLLLDMGTLHESAWRPRIQALRQRFQMGQLIGLGVRSDFEQLHEVLGGGCDSCLLEGTPPHAIIERIMELNERHEQEAFRVLIVEDSKTASHLIRRTLAENQIVSEIVNDPRQTLTALKQFNPDLILMDMYMPNCTGVEVARIIRQHNEFLSMPIVYLSGETNVALQVDAMRLGGDHFLTKPFNPVFLNTIVRSKIERYRALRRSMYHDSLTGLLNHSSGKNTLDMMLSGIAHEGGFLSVVMMDIDHFKQVNDSYGHPVGDQVIRSLSWLLKQRLRRHDILCRYGGEEFLVGLPHTDAEEAFAIMDRVRQDFAKIRHPYRDTHFHATSSAGIATYPLHQTGDALIKAADAALYRAKHGGRNRIQVDAD